MYCYYSTHADSLFLPFHEPAKPSIFPSRSVSPFTLSSSSFLIQVIISSRYCFGIMAHRSPSPPRERPPKSPLFFLLLLLPGNVLAVIQFFFLFLIICVITIHTPKDPTDLPLLVFSIFLLLFFVFSRGNDGVLALFNCCYFCCILLPIP